VESGCWTLGDWLDDAVLGLPRLQLTLPANTAAPKMATTTIPARARSDTGFPHVDHFEGCGRWQLNFGLTPT
jgi:hypothetical protein